MNKLVQAINGTAQTQNGAVSNFSTLDPVLDLFGTIGAARGKDLTPVFQSAFVNEPELAIRTLLWARDIRGGSGERSTFREILRFLAMNKKLKCDSVVRIMQRIPELGRFDDFMALWGTDYEGLAAKMWLNYISTGNGLAAKWAPVKDKKGALPLRTAMGMDERQWRKFVVPMRQTVEQSMCAREWGLINYEHVPSVASSRYSSAFARNDFERYDQFRKKVEKGEAKVNAGALFPYDPVKAVWHGRGDVIIASAQWEALRNTLPSDCNFLPIVDVSGSMAVPVGGNPNLSCMMVAVALGMYMAERNTGAFKDWFMTFNSTPEFVKLQGTFEQRVAQVKRANWGGSTNLQASFELLLNAAIQNKVPQEDMPKFLVIISDMEFDAAKGWGRQESNLDAARRKFEKAGYKMPHLIFWRVDVKTRQQPVTMYDRDTTLVSGFNTNLLKSIMTGEMDPVKAMLEVIMDPRYNF